jgi:FtsP/CotA-like multicopper oxidase with cupredoxin domain
MMETFMSDRRSFVRNAFGWATGLLAARAAKPATTTPVRVETTDLADLPFTIDNEVKVFHLIAEPVKRQIAPNKTLDLWGFNGTSPGPTIQVTEGDRVRIIVDNHLPESTSMHWHGLEIPNAMDGSPGLNQAPIRPGGRFVYEFTLHQNGTFFYHSHMSMQEMIGSLGAFILHPKTAHLPVADRDFVMMLQEYGVLPNNTIPDTMAMEFNWLVINGKAGPAITPLVVRLGQRVRIRMINLGMDHHPMHLHGHTFHVTGTEGGRIQESAWVPGNTAIVGVAQARDVEFVANNPGEWMFHCHLPHHMMNQMVSVVGPMTRGPKTKSNGIEGMDMSGNIAPDANHVPGFPQDAYMEGPMMAMDEMVKKPENDGLPDGWSGFMQGMMTLIRVLPPEQFDKIMAQRKNGAATIPGMHQMGPMPGMKEHK